MSTAQAPVRHGRTRIGLLARGGQEEGGPDPQVNGGSAATGSPATGTAEPESTGAPSHRGRRATERAPSRGSGHGPVVAITGAAHGLGHALAVRLAASAAVRRVVAIDDHRGDVVGVTLRLADVRDPALSLRALEDRRRVVASLDRL